MADADVLFRRLAARGYFEVAPTDYSVPDHHDETCEPDCRWEHSRLLPGVGITWAPKGQGGPIGGRSRFNFMCSRGVVRPTLLEALEAMVDLTRPSEHDVETLAANKKIRKALVADG
jgi:hypothetical protein